MSNNNNMSSPYMDTNNLHRTPPSAVSSLTNVLVQHTQVLPDTSTSSNGESSGKRKAVWDKVETSGNGCKCVRCGQTFNFKKYKKVERVENHFAKYCTGISETERHNQIQKLNGKQLVQCKITNLVIPKLTEDTQKKVLLALAEWFFTQGVAFQKVESLYSVLLLLRPDLRVMTRKELATRFLNLVYQKYQRKQRDALNVTSSVCLITDAWSSTNKESVVNHMLVIPGGTAIFNDAVYSGTESHTGLWLANDVGNVMESIATKYGCNVAGECTDNAAANQSAWKILQGRYPSKYFYGCVCHGIHLMCKDFLANLPWLKEICDNGKIVSKFFLRSNIQKAVLKSNGAPITLKMPVDTRWNSQLHMLEALYKNENPLNTTVSERDWVTKPKSVKKRKQRAQVKEIVQADGWVKRLKCGIKIFSLMAKYLVLFQGDSVALSEVYQMFNDLPNQYRELAKYGLPDHDINIIIEVIDERWDFMYSDAHGIAYALDPRFAGERIMSDDMEKVRNFIEERDPSIRTKAELVRFYAHLKKEKLKPHSTIDNINNKESPETSISVYEWWDQFRFHEFPGLKKVALEVFSLSPSSSASERNFSVFSYIHNKLRNRLSNLTVEKLVYIFVNSKKLNTMDDNNDFSVEYAECVNNLIEDESISTEAVDNTIDLLEDGDDIEEIVIEDEDDSSEEEKGDSSEESDDSDA